MTSSARPLPAGPLRYGPPPRLVSPLRAALAPLLVYVAAAGGGCAVGAATYAVLASRGDAEEAWAQLGWAIAALAAGALTAVVVLVVGVVVAARRLIEPGRRALPVVAGLVGPLVASVVTAPAGSLTPSYAGGGSPWAWAAVATLAVAAVGLAPAAFARAVQDDGGRRRTGTALLAAFLAGAVLTAAAAVDAQRTERRLTQSPATVPAVGALDVV